MSRSQRRSRALQRSQIRRASAARMIGDTFALIIGSIAVVIFIGVVSVSILLLHAKEAMR